MKLSDYLVQKIYDISRTDKFFGYIGGMVAHIIDSIYLNSNVEMVNTITEQSAGFAADAYARVNNKLGVAIATSGPGATNLVTAIANCFFDSTPVLFITGQVNTYEYRKYQIRQCGFQETNIVDIVRPITKYAKTITNKDDIKYELEYAYNIAMSGRKGPVLLDIPMDIQRADIIPEMLSGYNSEEKSFVCDVDYSVFQSAKKPLILVGNGINISNARNELSKLLNNTQFPVVQSMLGVDCVPSNYKYNLGMIGTYGNRAGNIAFYDCDLLLVLGSRLDIRQTGSNIEFMKNKKIIQVDIDNAELNCNKFDKFTINSDLKYFLKNFNTNNLKSDISKWQDKCLKLKNRFDTQSKTYKLPNIILDNIFNELKDGDIVTADVGQNQVWVGQSAKIQPNNHFITSGGLGSMGFSLPAAIGASICGQRVFAITGDGGFQMNIQELEIVKRRNLPIKIIVLNNNNLGMVRSFQKLYFDSRYASTVIDYSAPDFENIAKAYDIDAITVNADNFDIKVLKPVLNSHNPALINIIFEQNTETEPRLQFGNSIENSHPLLDEDVLKEILKD